jgi:hypothetical protein
VPLINHKIDVSENEARVNSERFWFKTGRCTVLI